MSNEVIKKETAVLIDRPNGEIAGKIYDSSIDKIVSMLPENIDPDQFSLALFSAVNELSRGCDFKSIAVSALNCAQLGLMPGSQIGHAYFVPFKGKCQLIIGYQGFIHLAFDTRFLSTVFADVVTVKELEDFKHWTDETGTHLRHDKKLDRKLDRENIAGAYCTYTTVDGKTGFEVVTREQINKVDKKSYIWKSHYVEMAKKTAVRRAAKFWNKSTRMAHAIHFDELAERDGIQEKQTGPKTVLGADSNV